MILSYYNMKIAPFCSVLCDPVTQHLRKKKKDQKGAFLCVETRLLVRILRF